MYRLNRQSILRIFSRMVVCYSVLTFIATSIFLPTQSYAQNQLSLPAPGIMVSTSPAFAPPVLKGLIIHPEQPFQFDFVFDSGDAKLTDGEVKEESTKLIKYFLASLTMPEDELWVNLSPYEKDRIIPEEFGRTEMGRDLLAQDYLLKQLTASMIYPEDGLGKKFWDKVYEKASNLYGTSEIPVNTFNKVWIIPDKALIYENGDRAFIVETHLKVLLEEDYFALEQNSLEGAEIDKLSEVSSSIIREVIIPEIEKEVNNGKNFAKLRQIYHSFILASWYKKNLQQTVLSQKYADQKKVIGLETDDKNVKDKIYQQYLNAFERGVYDFIKEDYDETTQELIPRKYFSGGVVVNADGAEFQRVHRPELEGDLRLNVGFSDPTNPTGGAITVDGKGLDEINEPRIDNAIRRDFEEENVASLNDLLVELDPDGIVASNGVVVWKVPSLEEFDDFLIAHAGRGGVANDHKKRHVYLSPKRVEFILGLSREAKRQFWEHEIVGHLLMTINEERRIPEKEVLNKYPIDLVVSAEIMELYKIGDSKQFRNTLREIGIEPEVLIPELKVFTEQYIRDIVSRTVFKQIGSGAEKRVFSTDSLDFVVGFDYDLLKSDHPPTDKLPESTQLAYERGGDVVGNVFYIRNATLKYLNASGEEVEVFVPYLLVQEKLTEFGKKMESLRRMNTDESKEQARDLYGQLVELHRRMYRRGIENYDIKIAINYGVNKDNQVVLLDTGRLGTKKTTQPIVSWYAPAPFGVQEPDFKKEFSLEVMEELWETDLEGALRSTFVNSDLEEPLNETIKKAVKKAMNPDDGDPDGGSMAKSKNPTGDGDGSQDLSLLSDVDEATRLTLTNPDGQTENPGGIDFNPSYLNIQSQGSKVDLPALSNPQQLQNIDIKGLVPIIFNIAPITNPTLILDNSENEHKEINLSKVH